jgi:hypothetical protein
MAIDELSVPMVAGITGVVGALVGAVGAGVTNHLWRGKRSVLLSAGWMGLNGAFAGGTFIATRRYLVADIKGQAGAQAQAGMVAGGFTGECTH